MDDRDRVLIDSFLIRWGLEIEDDRVHLQPSLIDEFSSSVYRQLSTEARSLISISDECIHIENI